MVYSLIYFEYNGEQASKNKSGKTNTSDEGFYICTKDLEFYTLLLRQRELL